MSTSESTSSLPVTPDAGSLGAGLHAGEAVPTGVISPSQIARLANEFFNALPDELQQPLAVAARVALPPNSAFTGNPYAAVPAPTAPAIPGLGATVTESMHGAFVDRPDRSIAPDLRPSTAAAPAYAVPVGTTGYGPGFGQGVATGFGSDKGFDPPNDSSFGFLTDARPLSAVPVAAQSQTKAGSSAAAASHAPTSASDETTYAAIPTSLEADRHPLLPTQPPAPTVPGAFGVVDSSAIPAFSFLEDARPLFSAPPSIPGPAPSIDATDKSAASPARPSISDNPFTTPIASSAPQFPGTVAHTPTATALVHRPQENPHGIDPFSVNPVLVPGEGQPSLHGDLGLSSYSFDVEAIRRDFPILQEVVNGHRLAWLDNGATTQKPKSVIDRISYFYEHENSNVHRAAHELAARATDAYESAREKTRGFLNASATREIVFVRGATEAINLIAQSWGRQNIQKDDEIVITWLEHHANIVPWQILCAEKGARLRVAPVDDSGQVLLDEYEKLLGPRTRLVSIAHVSNALGTIVPVKAMVDAAHRHGARVLVDGAQAVSHMRVDVQSIGCDFYVFSGHKVFAPTGIGVVFGKSEVLDHMPPWQGGGNMIQDVTFEKTLYQPPPQRFEAGTGNIADAVGLGAAIDYLDRVGIANVARHEHELLTYATDSLLQIPGLTIIGTAKEKASVLSFIMEGFRTEEIGDYLNRKGIAVRGGHHCAQPILRRFGIESTVRATFALYNTCEEVDRLIATLWDLRRGRNPGVA
jgi:cysteine desulfurase/selenocysteine lyase